MTAIATANPINQYFDVDGTPLDGGSLYFGQANANPLADPVAVYWDAAATQPALQPVRLLNGMPSRAGTPAQVFVDGDHSMLVLDRFGRRVFSARNSAEFGTAGALVSRFDALANSTDGELGAGMVGFNAELEYPPNTVGAALAGGVVGGALAGELADPTKGARMVAFQRGAAASIARTSYAKHADTLTSYDFLTTAQIADVSSGTSSIDVTAAFQAFVNECTDRYGVWMRGRYRISSPIVFDPSKSYRIAGENFAINATNATGLLNTADSPAMVFNNDTAGNFNPDIELAHFFISGTNAGTNQHGIYALRTPINLKEVYAANCQHGVWIERGYTSVFQNCIMAQNYQNGFFLDREANQVTFLHCIANSNARAPGGFAGFDLRGTLNNENLGITMIGCDTTSNGQASGAGNGIIIQHSQGVTITGHYGESNKTFGIYADISAKNVTVSGGFFLDEDLRYLEVDGLHHLQNHHRCVTSGLMRLTVQGSAGRDCFIRGNTYGGPFVVSRAFTNGAGERREQFNTGPPTVAGASQWREADIIWHNAPLPGGNIGWVCTAGGPVGTWRPFGMISS